MEADDLAVRAGDGRTGRKRQALPDGAAREREVVMRRGIRRRNHRADAGGRGLVGNDRIVGKEVADDLTGGELVERGAGFRQVRLLKRRDIRRLFRRGNGGSDRFERRDAIFVAMGEIDDVGAFRRAPARLARIGEEGDGRLRADKDQLFDIGERLDDLLREVRDALDNDAARAALEAGGKGVAEDARAGGGGDAARGGEALFFQRGATHEDRGLLTVLQRLRRGIDRLARDSGGCGHGKRGRGMFRLKPGSVGRQDQRCDLAGGFHRGLHGASAIGGYGFRAVRGMDPAGDGTRETHDVGGERRIVLCMVGRMVADDVDDGRLRAARIVEVRKAVGEARPKMEKRRGGLFRHAAIAVRRTGHRAFKQSEDRAHALDLVQRGDEMHLGRARIREADLDARVHQRPHKAFRTVHDRLP